MISAIIDCGTNTFNLLIVEYDLSGNYKQLLNTKESVKLFEGGFEKQMIAPVPFERGINTFLNFVKLAETHKASRIHAFATTAIRNSINGPDFVKTIFEKTQVMIQVLNGDTEAQYIYKGVKLALENVTEPLLIMDIGGGSTEFIIANENRVLWKRSFDLGATGLFMEFKPSDPITQEEIKLLKDHFKETLQPLTHQLKKYSVNHLIGCSGIFESISEIIQATKGKNKTTEKLFNIDENDFRQTTQLLINSTVAERRKICGLVEFRVDTIVNSTILIDFVIKRYKIPRITYSAYALKEGILYDLMDENVAV